MDLLGDMRLFLLVLDQGSISSAARSLDLSVAVASQRLKRLEADLNVRLFHRTTRRLRPTPEGLALARRGRHLVEDLEALTDDIRHGAERVGGTLKLTMPTSFGRQYISPLLPVFLARHPDVNLEVVLTDQVMDLVGEGFDLAIRIGALKDSSLVARRLAGERRILCAAPSYLSRYGRPVTPSDLCHHQCLLLDSDGRDDLWSLKGPDGEVEAVRVTGRVRGNQGELLSDAALAGLGIAQHSIWHIYDHLCAGRLEPVLPAYRTGETAIYAVMPARTLTPARVRAFVDFIAADLARHPPWDTLPAVVRS